MPNRNVAILPITITLLEQLFSLPDGYTIIGTTAGAGYDADLVHFVITSQSLPEVQVGSSIPTATVQVQQETLPGYPGFKRISTEVKLS